MSSTLFQNKRKYYAAAHLRLLFLLIIQIIQNIWKYLKSYIHYVDKKTELNINKKLQAR